VTELLQAARFTDVVFTDVREPVYYGPDVDAALDRVRGFTCTSEALTRLEPARRRGPCGRAAAGGARHAHQRPRVWLNSRAGIVTARRH
jgi:hypothetical protein